MPTFFDAMNDLMAAEVSLVVVTVVDTMGSVPQDRGAKKRIQSLVSISARRGAARKLNLAK